MFVCYEHVVDINFVYPLPACRIRSVMIPLGVSITSTSMDTKTVVVLFMIISQHKTALHFRKAGLCLIIHALITTPKTSPTIKNGQNSACSCQRCHGTYSTLRFSLIVDHYLFNNE